MADAPKTIFAEKSETLTSSDVLAITPRFRLDAVGKNLKWMKPYTATKTALHLKADQPVEV